MWDFGMRIVKGTAEAVRTQRKPIQLKVSLSPF